MKSRPIGKSTSEVEVTQISISGIWLLIDDKEFFLSFERFPWLRNATVGEIHDVQIVNDNKLRWPCLKIDLSMESIGKPEHVPHLVKAKE